MERSSWHQGCLNEKEAELDLCNIFAISKFNEIYSFVQLFIILLKPGRTVIFMKYITNIGPLIFLPKPLISNKMLLLGLNSLKVLGLV